MVAGECDFRRAFEKSGGPGPSAEVIELALLLHNDQFSALERLAGARGISIACLLRQMIRDFLVRESGAPSPRV